MFKYRVLTFTIILSMLLFYATPIGSIDVKAEEVTYTQRQLQDVGAWFIGERLLEGAVENFNFDNLPTDVSADDFLADLGEIIVNGNPDPLLDHLGQAADDIWNGIEQDLAFWTSDDAWSFVKDFFYTLWYDVNPPQYSPLVDVLKIQDGINEQLGVYDRLLQYANTDLPSINPDINYAPYLEIINGSSYNLMYANSDYWLKNYNRVNSTVYDSYYLDIDPSQYSLIPHTNSGWNNYLYQFSSGYFLSYYSNPTYRTSQCLLCEPVTLYISGSDSSWSITSSSFDAKKCCYDSRDSSLSYAFWATYDTSSNIYRFAQIDYNQPQPIIANYTQSATSLEDCFKYIVMNFRNVNIYVNGDIWSYPFITPINPIASTDLTYPNYEPAKYTYPEGTSVDWNRLYTIIYNAVRDGIVIDFGDIEDCFVDVNGQTAIATLGLVRNDYDNLVQEQFTMVPYPRFNDNLWLSNLAEEMTEPAQNGVAIIENAYNIFPLPLQKALLFAGALLLFGLLIRRFLE